LEAPEHEWRLLKANGGSWRWWRLLKGTNCLSVSLEQERDRLTVEEASDGEGEGFEW
jgi:hypothetical protein